MLILEPQTITAYHWKLHSLLQSLFLHDFHHAKVLSHFPVLPSVILACFIFFSIWNLVPLYVFFFILLDLVFNRHFCPWIITSLRFLHSLTQVYSFLKFFFLLFSRDNFKYFLLYLIEFRLKMLLPGWFSGVTGVISRIRCLHKGCVSDTKLPTWGIRWVSSWALKSHKG